jgi:hypothetical protein
LKFTQFAGVAIEGVVVVVVVVVVFVVVDGGIKYGHLQNNALPGIVIWQ